MMLKLVDIFGYLSVLLRAGTLVFQSLLLGGWLFLFCIARPSREIADSNGFERVRSASLRMFRAAAIALVIVQVLYLYVNSSVLMATAEIRISGVAGANFFIAGSVILVAALTIAATASLPGKLAGWWLALLVLIVLGASVMTNHAAARMENRVPLIILILDWRTAVPAAGTAGHQRPSHSVVHDPAFLAAGAGKRDRARAQRLGDGPSLHRLVSLALWDCLWGDGHRQDHDAGGHAGAGRN
jgi:hypothetical protein